MQPPAHNPFVAIACGGTGGHVFPGIAVGEALRERDCEVTLLISPKEVDQMAVKSAPELPVAVLPAVALNRGDRFAFLRGFWRSYRAAKKMFHAHPPQAVLAMGGFTSAPPVLASRSFGAATFLHEANSLPGRANRWLAVWVDQAFVYFPGCAKQLRHPKVSVAGMPVRRQFQKMDATACRLMLGLDAQRPVLLVMGGSQGASAINDLIIHALPMLNQQIAGLQYLHLTGLNDEAKVRAAYARYQAKAVILPFLTEMELALNAATAAISRAGASSLAELAAVGVPTLLIPYPKAAQNHQFYNALALVEGGAARMMAPNLANPKNLTHLILDLINQNQARQSLLTALNPWHRPQAAEEIADQIMETIAARWERDKRTPTPAGTQPVTDLLEVKKSLGK